MDENTRKLAQFLLSDDARMRRQRQNLALAGYDTSGYQPTFGPGDSNPEQAGPEVGPMRQSPVNPIVAGPDQASFLTSEKDTRPHWETDQRAMLMPLVMSGYNNSVSYGVPSILGGHAWSTMGDIVKGNAVHPDEIAHSANDAAGAAMLGSMPMGAPRGAIRSGAARTTPETGRSLDSLGYYSAALEAAKSWPQGKGTPEQALTWLKKSGTKDAEIAATGLDQALAGRPSVTRDELISHLEGNRVGLNEASRFGSADDWRARTELPAIGRAGIAALEMLPNSVRLGPTATRVYEAIDNMERATTPPRFSAKDGAGPAKWQEYSLDPSNPTYRETVLHLPERGLTAAEKQRYNELQPRYNDDALYERMTPAERADYRRMMDLTEEGQNFRSGHFPEPNIVGHMMTSVNRHEGKPVFTLDQIQSDWGQKIRDGGGLRDQTKIDALRKQVRDIGIDRDWLAEAGGDLNRAARNARDQLGEAAAAAYEHPDARRLLAELQSAEQATSSGHPLVNTTDQWTNTTLRRALQQAIEQDAQHIAVPRGDTVLSYNPGDTHGMNTFYNEIVPKNLAKILERLDKAGVSRRQVDQLETPSGMKGSGFTLFDITPKMREEARKGLPLFANPPTAALAALLLGQEPQE